MSAGCRRGEKYLLHRWLLKREKEHGVVYGYPGWLVVTVDEGKPPGWQIVKDNVCPRCGREVVLGTEGGEGEADHRYCQELWAQIGWRPGGRVK